MDRSTCCHQLCFLVSDEVPIAYKVTHVCDSVDHREKDNGPTYLFYLISKMGTVPRQSVWGHTMERDVLVEWDDRVEGCTSKERDKVAAHGEEDEDHVD